MSVRMCDISRRAQLVFDLRGSIMEIPVLVEPLPEGGFRARCGDPFALTAEGATPDAALYHLRDLHRIPRLPVPY